MHICFFTHYTEMAGGSNFSLFELIKNLNNLGVEVTLISPCYGEINKRLDAIGVRNKGFPFFPFKSGFYTWTTPNDSGVDWLKNRVKMQVNKMTAYKIARYLKDLHVDIIHTNCSVTCVGAKVADMLNIPHIWHIREYNVEDFGWSFIYGRENSIHKIEQYSKELIFISHDLREKYKLSCPSLKDHPIIYNGIDKKRFYYKKDKNSFFSNDLCIAMSGGVQRHKNQGELIQAISLLPPKYRNHIKCVFIGPADAAYLKELQLFIEKHGLTNQIEFLGHRSDVNQLLRGAHIAVMASRCEAFGRVTVEYMMSGLAVIVSNTGANPEIVADGQSGLVYHYGDSKDLSEKIQWYMNNRERMAEIATNGQRVALDHFTSDINTKNIYNLYKKILNQTS